MTGTVGVVEGHAGRALTVVVTVVCLALSTAAVALARQPAAASPRPDAHSAVKAAATAPHRAHAPAEVSAPESEPAAVRHALAAAGVPTGTVSDPGELAAYVQARPTLASRLVARLPRRSARYTPEARLAAATGPILLASGTNLTEARRDAVYRAFASMHRWDRDRLALLFPAVVGNLPGAPFPQRALANRVRVIAALADTQAAPAAPPDAGWRRWWPFDGTQPEASLPKRRAAAYRAILAENRMLLYFDPRAAEGRGAWAELVGQLGPRTTAVGLLVPGGSAYLTGTNFDRYHDRAAGFVDTASGSVAMVVWAAGEFPGGWMEESMARYDRLLAHRLVGFSRELRHALTDAGSAATVTAVGHSYGGAVIGAAEQRGLSVDRVLHVASAGTGEGVRHAADYPVPARPRYSMTAPGDWISYVQGLSGPAGLGIGHGADPDVTPGFIALATGSLPADPALPDEFGEPIGALAAAAIAGRRAHSTLFIRYSDAWWNMYHVITGGPVATLPPPHLYSAPANPATSLPSAPFAGSLARSCYYHRHPRRRRIRCHER